jgi:hypothetical protein
MSRQGRTDSTPGQDRSNGRPEATAAGKVKGMRIATAFRSLALAAALSIVPAVSHAGVFVAIHFGGPPVLPVYVQPPCPAPGYIWTPGYWSWNDAAGSYYWVPGAWVLAPYSGALWTPGYWAYGPTGYAWNAGYWGPHIGFYGGVNYGFGYFGRGFEGGYWDRGAFRYNTAIVHVDNVRFRNVVYNKTVIVNRNVNRVSFNGGHGGIDARPTADEQRWSHEQHTAPLAAQRQNEMRASQNRAQFANVNHGRPENLARTQPAAFNRSAATNNRPANNFNHGTMNNNNVNRPASFNNANRPAAASPNFSHGPQQTYRPQAQGQNRPAQQQAHPTPQQSHPEEHGGGHDGGGHGGRGR